MNASIRLGHAKPKGGVRKASGVLSPARTEMENPKKSVTSLDWKLILAALLALGLVIGGIAYKYTGDFTGFTRFGTSGQSGRQ